MVNVCPCCWGSWWRRKKVSFISCPLTSKKTFFIESTLNEEVDCFAWIFSVNSRQGATKMFEWFTKEIKKHPRHRELGIKHLRNSKYFMGNLKNAHTWFLYLNFCFFVMIPGLFIQYYMNLSWMLNRFPWWKIHINCWIASSCTYT